MNEKNNEVIKLIDEDGFRLNVGIVLINNKGQVFWGKRIGAESGWQFPQGGIHNYESAKEAMYRELHEELGLEPEDVEFLAVTHGWLRYWLPKHLRRYNSKPLCVGQKQKWFLLRFVSDEDKIHFDSTDSPEFQGWEWVDFWHPLAEVIEFKEKVYRQVLNEFRDLVRKC